MDTLEQDISRDGLFNLILQNKRCKRIMMSGVTIINEYYNDNDTYADLTLLCKDKNFSNWAYLMRVTYVKIEHAPDYNKPVVQVVDFSKEILENISSAL